MEQQRILNTQSQPVRFSDFEDIVASIKAFRTDLDHQDHEDLERPKKRARHSPEASSGEEKPGAENVLSLPQNMQIWSSTLLDSALHAKITRAWHRILLSLKFPDMRIRESNIYEAHQNTCDWVLEPDQGIGNKHGNSLPLINTWLRFGDGVFWLAGKAGSGKSTLMKHAIRQATKIEKLVGEWAGEKRVVIASFYFWNSGSRLQKSQEGLLRTIFYQIFHSCPELIPKLCPKKWQEAKAGSDHVTDWTLMDLLELLRKFFALDITTTAFCFFIDGLDEFDGDPLDLIKTILKLDKNPSIKMCLSSRPWNCFEEAFGKDKSRCLRLEDHNYDDILRFVRDTISSCAEFPHLQQEGPEWDSLINEIVEKANGVFLWVFLVTRSLMRGLINGDSIHTLHLRLREFPPELEPYFMHMFKSIEQVYLQETAELLQISAAAREPHPTMLYQALLAPSIEAYGDGLKMLFETSNLKAFVNSLEVTKRRVNARCQDLLETTICPLSVSAYSNPFMEAYHGSKVEFLHRTVSDFLRTPEMTTILSKHVRKDFEPRSRTEKAFQTIFGSFEYLKWD